MEQELLKRARKKRIRTISIIVLILVFSALAIIGPDHEKTAPPGADDPAKGRRGASVTMSINCSELSEHMDRLTNENVRDYIPKDGQILAETEVSISEGDSVYDVLYRTCRDKDIHLETSDSPTYGSRYVEGIGHLYEMDAGRRSGWTYYVNGEMPNYGCSKYLLSGGEDIRWTYVTGN